ncbi:unnamed protein product [Rotaria sp. Silwood2]|nr:unnamed protein product [Rotaria sp. Silwood2]CAF4563339.1 unnamed protein product [Rotaria sp. Silwood2]
MDCDNIDLNRTEQTTSLLNNDEQQGYQPRTLPNNNNGRYAYLPIFPTKFVGLDECLLLANVPVTRLAPHEIARRQHGAYISDALMMMNKYNYFDEFSLSESDAEELSVRLQVDKSIITFNAIRLRGICCYVLALHESFRRHVLFKKDVALKEPTLNSKQMAMVLEFYLQIDVDLFYMKTCSFRGAEPRSNIEGLFCGKDVPQARYSVFPCSNLFCLCCHPLHSHKKSQSWSVVEFVSSSMHQFVNGYTTYLNCPATCTTSNVVYAMTCPCGQYDYVDSAADTLTDAMAYHRAHGNRIIHEKLTGSPVYRGSLFDPMEKEKEIANEMRLYQHSARCSIALRSFLDCNPIYWCFIPLLWEEALAENAVYYQGTIVPLPPAAYGFSYGQLQKQRLFFEHFVGSSIHQLPYVALDLYKMAIIAVRK